MNRDKSRSEVVPQQDRAVSRKIRYIAHSRCVRRYKQYASNTF